MKNTLNFLPVAGHLDLVSVSVARFVNQWRGSLSSSEFLVAEIDPDKAGGADFCTTYGVSATEGANCVIIEARRGNTRTIAACVAPVGYRMDFSGVIRKHLGARQVSVAPLDEVLAATQMEYGSITPIGLPSSWPILIDSGVFDAQRIIMGSGLRRSKLSVPSMAFHEMENVTNLTGIGIK